MSKESEKLEQKLDEKLDKIHDKLSSIDVTLVKQAGQLEHHIYRTKLAEENLEILKNEMKPIQKHVTQVSGILKFFGILSVFAGIVKAVLEVYKLF
jgi:archaellum component FlaC